MVLVTIATALFLVLSCQQLRFSGRPLAWVTALSPCFDFLKQGFAHGWLCVVASRIDRGLGLGGHHATTAPRKPTTHQSVPANWSVTESPTALKVIVVALPRLAGVKTPVSPPAASAT